MAIWSLKLNKNLGNFITSGFKCNYIRCWCLAEEEQILVFMLNSLEILCIDVAFVLWVLSYIHVQMDIMTNIADVYVDTPSSIQTYFGMQISRNTTIYISIPLTTTYDKLLRFTRINTLGKHLYRFWQFLVHFRPKIFKSELKIVKLLDLKSPDHDWIGVLIPNILSAFHFWSFHCFVGRWLKKTRLMCMRTGKHVFCLFWIQLLWSLIRYSLVSNSTLLQKVLLHLAPLR